MGVALPGLGLRSIFLFRLIPMRVEWGDFICRRRPPVRSPTSIPSPPAIRHDWKVVTCQQELRSRQAPVPDPFGGRSAIVRCSIKALQYILVLVESTMLRCNIMGFMSPPQRG